MIIRECCAVCWKGVVGSMCPSLLKLGKTVPSFCEKIDKSASCNLGRDLSILWEANVVDKNRNIILVTGATGNQGGAIAHQLLSSGCRVRAMTRNPQSAGSKALAAMGAELVKGDFDDPESLEYALKGVWGAYSVQNTWMAGVAAEEEYGKRFAEIARKMDIGHFVYSSVGSAHRNTGILR